MSGPNLEMCLEEWAQKNVGGLSEDEVHGLKYPLDMSKVSEAYDRAFERFQPLVKIGKRKFAGGYLRNTPKNKVELIKCANLLAPKFEAFINEFVSQNTDIYASCGINNEFLIKSGDGLDFKLKYKTAEQIRDMVRTSIICPTITSLEATIRNFIEYCKASGLDYCNVNFYDNVAKFGEADRVDVNHPFGYVGVHFDVAFTVDGYTPAPCVKEGETAAVTVGSTTSDSAPEQADKEDAAATAAAAMPAEPAEATEPTEATEPAAREPTILVAEIQFHPATIYDGTPHCLKERQHAAYRAFHMKTAQKDPETARKTRAAIEMQYAHAMAVTPL